MAVRSIRPLIQVSSTPDIHVKIAGVLEPERTRGMVLHDFDDRITMGHYSKMRRGLSHLTERPGLIGAEKG